MPQSLLCDNKRSQIRKQSYIITFLWLEEGIKSERVENRVNNPMEQLTLISTTLEKSVVCQASVDMISYTRGLSKKKMNRYLPIADKSI